MINLSNDELRERLAEALERITELEKIKDYCPHCGCTEMLCGFNGSGCSHDEEE